MQLNDRREWDIGARDRYYLWTTSQKNIVAGRDAGSGNFRAWGLEFGDLLSQLEGDKLFEEAIRIARGRTLVTRQKLANLFLLLKYWLPSSGPGSIVEFGAYRGGCAAFMAFVANELGLQIEVYALDSFSGMPTTNPDIDLHKGGDFRDTSFLDVVDFGKETGLVNLHFVPGLFEDTAQGVLKTCPPVILAHIDCDIYSSVAYAYDVLKRYIFEGGGYLVFDDPLFGSCLGAFQAVEELVIRRDCLSAEQVFPHLVYRYPPML